jgi:acyl carrier protein
MTETEIREKIRQYIVKELMRDASYPLSNSEGICTGGLIDSTGLAEVGVYIEEAFGVYIPDPELTVAKMDTLDLMVARVLRDV